MRCTSRRGGIVRVGDELGVGNSETIKQRQIQRQQRLADMKARETLFLENDGPFAGLGEECGNRGAGGAAARFALPTILA
jgi:hypothetical protein